MNPIFCDHFIFPGAPQWAEGFNILYVRPGQYKRLQRQLLKLKLLFCFSSISAVSLAVHCSSFLVWNRQHHLWHFLSVSLSCFFSKQRNTSDIHFAHPGPTCLSAVNCSITYIPSLISIVSHEGLLHDDFLSLLRKLKQLFLAFGWRCMSRVS